MTKKTKIILISLVLLLAGGGVFAWLQNDDQLSDSPQPVGRTKNTETTADGNTDSEATESESTDSAPTKQQAEVTMTTPVNGQEFEGDTIRVRAIVEGATGGTCTVKFMKTGYKTVQQSVSLVRGPSYYACNGWDISRSKFPASGKWDIYVSFTSDSAEGRSETRTITLK